MAKLKLRAETKQELVRQALEWYRRAYEAERDNRQEMIEDLQFSWGNQWEATVIEERARDLRPTMTFDRCGDIIRKAMKSVRDNRPSIKTLPVENADDETSEVITDLIREIEYASGGSRPYLYAEEMAMRMGYGVFEICTKENDTDVWAQDLMIKRVPNPFTVYFDPASTHPTKADGKFCIKSQLLRCG